MHPTLQVVDALAAAGWKRHRKYTRPGERTAYLDVWTHYADSGTQLRLFRDPGTRLWGVWFVTVVYEGFRPDRLDPVDTGYECPLAAHTALLMEGEGDVVRGAYRLRRAPCE